MAGTKTRVSRCLLLLAVAALACNSGDSAPKVPLAQAKADSVNSAAGDQAEPTLSPAAQAALNSGNALFRKKEYAQALAQYRLASKLSPEHPVPYIGIGMVAQKTGNKALSDSAQAAIVERGAEPPMMPHASADSAARKVQPSPKKGPIS